MEDPSLSFGVQITDINVPDIVIKYFDELMAMSELVGEYEDVFVSSNSNNGLDPIMRFNLIFKSIAAASIMLQRLSILEISKYGHTYVPSITQNGCVLNIILIDRRNTVSSF